MTTPTSTPPLRLIDRSRTIAWQRCPRSRYLEYELMGRGIRKIRATVPLVVGTYVHIGLGELLLGNDVDQAVETALAAYAAEMKRRGFDLEPGEDALYVANESKAMIEALVRAYAIKGLPQLAEQFEVLEVEQEELWEEFAPNIGWMARADGLLRERATSDLYVLSFKTAASWDARTDRQNAHDIQGLSEVAAIEARLAGWWKRVHDGSLYGLIHTVQCSNEMYRFLESLDAPPRILGVKMIYLLKGCREEYPEDSGQWITQSHLLRGWSRNGITGPELAWRYKWYGPDTWPDTGRLRGHTLGKGWTRFNAWEQPGGVKAWIELLAGRTVQPDAGDPLESVIYEPQPYYRQQQDMEDWHEQTAQQERNVAEAALEVERARVMSADGQRLQQWQSLRQALNYRFPQNRHSCDYPSKCQFQEICFGDDSMLTNPLGSGLYELREPHHRPEMDRRKGLPSAADLDADAAERKIIDDGRNIAK